MRTRWLALLLGALAVLGGCGSDGSNDARDDGKLDVVASFYPLADAARAIGGDAVNVTNLTPVGVEPHDFELTADQVDALEDADVVLYVGADFQPAVAEVAHRRPANTTIDLATSEDDPHFWLDPVAMAAAADKIAALLHADATAYKAELTALDTDFRTGLADCQRRDIVTTHAAFGQLARRYNLNELAIAGRSPEGEPDANRLAELADQTEAKGITTIFFEELAPRDIAETLVREAHLKAAVLSPIEGLSKEEQRQGKTYISVMRDNLRALRTALACK